MNCAPAIRWVRGPMIDKRVESRSEMRRRRALAASDAIRKTGAACDRTADAVDKARIVLVDPAFAELLRVQGVQTWPRPLTANEDQTRTADGSLATAKERLNEVSLEFVIAWTFFFPLFSNPVIAAYLDTTWPGFVGELKDTFIELVVQGPFPHAMSGHRGRRHGARYHAGIRSFDRRG
jgi:hypothetical protein